MPEWLNSLRLRLRALTRRHQLEQDLQDEMAFHLAMREEQQRQAGVPADQASGHYERSASLTETVRRTLLELAPGIRVYTVQPLGVHVARSFGQLQWITSILIGFGVLALLLAAVGLYGAIAYRVSLRTREIGLRMALGATRLNVFRGVVGNALAIVVVGVAIGEFLTTVLTGIVASVQEGIVPAPLSTHVIVGLIWMAIGITASYVPAARAARLDPSVTLREE